MKPPQLSAVITPCGPEDFDRMLQVWEASVRSSHDFLSTEQIDALVPVVPGAFRDADHIAAVRDAEGQVVGFVGTKEAKLEMLFIAPTAQGQGSGKALLDHARHVLGAKQVDVNEGNLEAIRFYEHHGAVQIGRSETDDYGNPYPLLHYSL